jgi:hypothetical protein
MAAWGKAAFVRSAVLSGGWCAKVDTSGDSVHRRSSQNSPSETVWKFGMSPEAGPVGPPGGADRLLFAPSWRQQRTVERPSSYFPNSFSTHFDE